MLKIQKLPFKVCLLLLQLLLLRLKPMFLLLMLLLLQLKLVLQATNVLFPTLKQPRHLLHLAVTAGELG